eukprot:1183275-Rhodomonas_salina.2
MRCTPAHDLRTRCVYRGQYSGCRERGREGGREGGRERERETTPPRRCAHRVQDQYRDVT